MASVHAPSPSAPGSGSESEALFRSGAAARMAHMPVATLRVWEQRYQALQPRTAPSGHRLYTMADVERLRLLRRLTQQGHAIGSLAALAIESLQTLDGQHPPALPPGTALSPPGVRDALRVVVVGPALAARLERPQVARQLARPVRLLAVHTSLAQAECAVSPPACDLLVWHTPDLLQEDPAALLAAQSALGADGVAVVYRFSSTAAKVAYSAHHIALLREPADDAALGAWFARLEARHAAEAAGSPAVQPEGGSASGGHPARRYDDLQLTAIAGMSSELACECPRHVAELLMLLSDFEAYSGRCRHRNPQDAALHAELQQLAGRARTMFEQALERVAQHEGLALVPAVAGADP